MKLTTRFITLFALVAGTVSLQAHHSSHMFEVDKPHWLKGTVTSYLPYNPHVIFTMEVTREDGQVAVWTVEGPRLARLEQLNAGDDFLKIGEELEVCGFFYQKSALAVFSREDQTNMTTNRLHGRLLVKAGGNKWLWGPYGNLQHCVNPDQWDTIIHGTYPLPAKPAA